MGNYFDDSGASLEATAKSLNGIDLVYPREDHKLFEFRHRGGGLRRRASAEAAFNDAVAERVLKPLGMTDGQFRPVGFAPKEDSQITDVDLSRA